MEQRVSLITLAVDDLDRARSFYQALGWRVDSTEEGVVAFNLLGSVIGLYPRSNLMRDIGLEESGPPPIFSGITLSHNVREKDQVAEMLAEAEAAGARILKPAHDVFWGGHIGYFADPDGHIWEVAYNPFAPLGSDGAFQWGGA